MPLCWGCTQASPSLLLHWFLDGMTKVCVGGAPSPEGVALHGQLMSPELTGCIAELVGCLSDWQLEVAREAASQRLLAQGQRVRLV
jgi:hypothetical protein